MAGGSTGYCMLCDSTPCECRPRTERRKSQRKPVARVEGNATASAPATEPATTERVTISAERRRDARRYTPRPDETNPEEPDAEDEDLIEAVRLLAHMVKPVDLIPFAEYLTPTDYLAPEERREAWLTSHYGEIDDSGATR